MATAELVSDGNCETEFTSHPITSDQSRLPSASNPNHTPAIAQKPLCSDAGQHPSPPSLDTSSQTIPDTPQTQKDCSVFLDDNSTPQVCQQIEIVTEEASCNEPCLPKIDAVWSIFQKHSYEQKPRKCMEHKDTHMPQHVAEPDAVCNTSPGSGTEACIRCVEIEHTPILSCSHIKGNEVIKAHTVHMPQILNIKSNPSKKYFLHDSPNPSTKPSKYLTLHGGKSQAMTKSYKTLKVLKLPSKTSAHSSWNNCLIDHNLKPLQIQHNLEHKNKALAVLKLETLSLKYKDESDESEHYSFASDQPPSPASPFSGRGQNGNYLLKDTPNSDPDYCHTDEEVGTDAVYLDVDQDSSNYINFMDSMQQEELEDGNEGGGVADQNDLHNLSMDQYLPDFTDLPPFHNIPMDQAEDQYAEPTHLTPSIHHNVLNYDWLQTDPSWYSSSSSSTLSSPSGVVPVPNLVSSSALPNTNCIPTVSYTSSLEQFMDSTAQNEVSVGCVTSALGGVGAASNMLDIHSSSPANPPCATTPLSTATTFNAATDTTVDTGACTMINIKTEIQAPWNRTEGDPQTNAMSSGVPQLVSSSEEATLTPCSADSQTLGSDSTISTALMTAFDLDSQHTSLLETQTSVSSASHSTYSYPDPPYPDQAYQGYPNHLYSHSSGLGMGCSSTFLSPPPSVEPQLSQHSTPCPDNESGYLTMEEQDLQSPGHLYWPNHHQQQQQHCPASVADDVDNSYSSMTGAYPANGACGFGEGGGYPYTHQDSHYQTLHQTASTAAATTTSSDIIYYPFSDLMQLNPSLLGSDSDMSIQYIHPTSYPHPYSQHMLSDPCHDPNLTQTYLHQQGGGRKRGRGGRSRGGRLCQSGQIQSDQISSSLQRQMQAQMGAPPKRQYRRRNPDGRRKPSIPKVPQRSGLEGGERKGRHNEPLNQKAVDIMYDWYREHEDNPYPSKEEKEMMALEGSITTMQVKSWFANKRNRSNNTRPKVQKRAMEEKLMQIYNQLSKTEGTSVQEGGNSFIIKELSQIIHNKLEPDNPATPESAT